MILKKKVIIIGIFILLIVGVSSYSLVYGTRESSTLTDDEIGLLNQFYYDNALCFYGCPIVDEKPEGNCYEECLSQIDPAYEDLNQKINASDIRGTPGDEFESKYIQSDEKVKNCLDENYTKQAECIVQTLPQIKEKYGINN